MYFHTLQSGYSMVEVLVAISILLIATAGPMTIVARALQYAEYSAQQNTAYFLAQEGIEAVFKVRGDEGLDAVRTGTNDSWEWVTSPSTAQLSACFDSDGCGIDWGDETSFVEVSNCSTGDCRIWYDPTPSGRSRYIHGGSGDAVLTPYTRVVELAEEPLGEHVRVRATVTWDMHPSGSPQEVVLETYLHNIYDFTP
jgi:prepilin-type N-terminal cleavage/methylation domain-containing protein